MVPGDRLPQANSVLHSHLTSRIEFLEKQLQASANAVKYPEKKCRNCQRTGHLAEECFRKGGGKEGQYPAWWKGKQEGEGGTSTANITLTPGGISPGVAELTQHYGLATSLHGEPKIEIYADTGASDHFFRDRNDFATY
ncbi:hypothetical protein F5050DRAFT_1561947, partial [Lentinula boryana]